MNHFVESIKYLYQNDMLDRDKIIDLYKNNKLTIEETNYVLDSNVDSNAF